jgi:hypothetical protein
LLSTLLRITSKNYADVSIFAGDLYNLDLSNAGIASWPITDTNLAISGGTERASDSSPIACASLALAIGENHGTRTG